MKEAMNNDVLVWSCLPVVDEACLAHTVVEE